MRKVLLAAVALLTLTGDAVADQVFTDQDGMITILPAGGNQALDLISCEVLGASNSSQGRPGFMDMFFLASPKLVKPAPGWCFKVNSGFPPKTVPVQERWPLNLGKIQNILGVECAVAPDRMSFLCDWPN